MKIRDKIKFKLKIREEYKGAKVRPLCKEFYENNKETVFDGEVMWLQDGADKYPNEYAIKCDKFEKGTSRAWISSGDIEVLE